MRFINKIKSNVSKKEFIVICAFSLMWVFNYFIFNQFDVMLHNQAEFGVKVAEVIWAFVWRALLILFAEIICLTALCCFRKKAFVITIALLFGFAIAGYAQALFMNKEELMAVAGSMALESVWEFILNSIIYLLIASIPCLLIILVKKKKLQKKALMTLAIALSAVVLGMQTIGVVTAAASAPKPAANNELYYFSIEQQLKLSKNDNIIVFVMDRLDTDFTDAVLEKDQSTKGIFDGFTYYTNNISAYPGTFPSVPAMLTDSIYDKTVYSNQKDFLIDTWSNAKLFDALHENDYIVNALLDTTSTIYDFKDLDDRGIFDNIRQVKRNNRTVKQSEFFGAMLSFAQIRQSPDALKVAFRTDRYTDIANYCVDIKNTPDYFPRTVSPGSDLRLYNKLLEQGLSADEEKNVFSFVHMQSSHTPYKYDENLKTIKNGRSFNDAVSQTTGSFKILEEYFSQMKELEIYESSTIIVVADHGSWNNKKTLSDVSMSTLMIKEKGQGSNDKNAAKTFYTDGTAELSNGNFAATIFELIGEDELKTCASYFDIINSDDKKQTRIFYYIKWVNLGSISYIATYQINGDANELENWVKIA